MGVSENDRTPKSSIFNRVFHYKPSILGYHNFRKHPYIPSLKQLAPEMDGWKTTPLSFWGAKGLFSRVNSLFVEEYVSLKNRSPPQLSGISFRDQGQKTT